MSGIGGPALLSLISGPILARSLGVEERGRFALMITLFNLAIFALEIGLSNSILVSTGRSGGRVASTERRVSGIYCVTGLVGSLCAIAATAITHDYMYLLVLGMSLPAVFFNIPRGTCLAFSRTGALVFERWSQAALRLLIVALLAFLGVLTASTGFIVYAGAVSLGAICLIIPWLKAPKAKPSDDFGVLRYGLTAWVAGIGSTILLRLDQLVLARVEGPQALGLYAVAVGLSEAMLMLTSALKMNYQGQIAQQGNASILRRPLAAVTIIGLLVALIMAFLGRFVLTLLYGDEFAGAAMLFFVLLLAAVPGMLMDLSGGALAALGKVAHQAKATALAALATVVLLVPAIMMFGAMGCAVVSLVAYLIGATYSLSGLGIWSKKPNRTSI
nr:oligosaccharide flippase family protein [Kineosporia sp. NBRC 101731]